MILTLDAEMLCSFSKALKKSLSGILQAFVASSCFVCDENGSLLLMCRGVETQPMPLRGPFSRVCTKRHSLETVTSKVSLIEAPATVTFGHSQRSRSNWISTSTPYLVRKYSVVCTYPYLGRKGSVTSLGL
jgi:hypothetical protein